MKKILAALVISSFSFSVFATTQIIDCAVANKNVVAMNRFTLTGSIQTNEKGAAIAQLSGTTQMAGISPQVSEKQNLELTGNSHLYAAGILGHNEVTSMTLTGSLDGSVVQLIALSGLSGSQSTLTIGGIPFRAECKLR